MNRPTVPPAPCRRVLSALAMAACLALAPAAAPVAETREGTAAYLRGDYDAAFREFQRSAEAGDAVSQFNLGGMYFEGRGIERNLRESAFWFRKAAEQGVAVAEHGLAVLYYRGAGVQRDYPEAARWFRKAAEQGLANAQFNLGVLYYRGEGVTRDIKQMLSWIQKAADQGFMPAAFQMGVIYENGVGVATDNAKALTWYERAASGGHPRARERIKAIVARTGLANAGDLPPLQSSGKDAGQRNDALGGIPTFIRSASETGLASAPRPEPPAEVRSDAPPARLGVTGQAAAVQPPPEPARPAPPAVKPPDRPAAVAKPAEPAPPAGPAVVAVAKAPAPRALGPGGYLVQLASLPSEALAQKAWQAISHAIPDPLSGYTPVYKGVDLGPRGTYTRVYVGPFDSREQAAALCGNITRRDPKQGCLLVPATP